MMKMLRYLPLLAMALVSTAGGADDRQTISQGEISGEIEQILARPEIGLADLLLIAGLSNPDLAMARIEVQARTGRLRQAGLYPNPELSLEGEEWSLDDSAFYKQKVELSQVLVIGGRRGAALDAARTAVDQAGVLAQGVRRKTLLRVHHWWADQIHFREVEETLNNLMAEADQTLAIARTRYEAKAAPEAHVTRAMLEVYDLEVVRQDFERERVRSLGEMRIIFGGLSIPVERVTGNLDPANNTTSLLSGPGPEIGSHPALLAARLGVETAEAELETARKERIPDLTLFAAYSQARPDEGDFVAGGISFPLPIFNRNQGRVLETTSLVTTARHQERLASFELEVALDTARLNYHASRQQLSKLTEQIAPAAERALTQARDSYRAGRLMFLELVDAQQTNRDVLLRAITLRRDLALAEADLMSLLGAGPYADLGEE